MLCEYLDGTGRFNSEFHQESQPTLAPSLIAQQFMPADVRTSRPSLSTKLNPPLTLANLVTSDHGADIETQRTVHVSGCAEPTADGTASTAAAISTRRFIVYLLDPAGALADREGSPDP
jgi:hypothetical protein